MTYAFKCDGCGGFSDKGAKNLEGVLAEETKTIRMPNGRNFVFAKTVRLKALATEQPEKQDRTPPKDLCSECVAHVAVLMFGEGPIE